MLPASQRPVSTRPAAMSDAKIRKRRYERVLAGASLSSHSLHRSVSCRASPRPCRSCRMPWRTQRRRQRHDCGAQLAQRVCRRYPLFKADVAEHRPLEVLVASHLSCLGRSWMASDRSGPHGRRRRIFQRPVKSWFKGAARRAIKQMGGGLLLRCKYSP